MFGSINVKSRPLRLAFLIQPSDRETLKKVFQINSTIWGGTYNPVIPLYRQTPSHWKEYPKQRINWKEIALGYIQAFDPDIIVNCTSTPLPAYITHLKKITIELDEIWKEFRAEDKSYSPKYAVGVFELLGDIFDKKFKHVRRFPYRVLLTGEAKSLSLVWTAWFGQFPDDIQEAIKTDYAEALDIENVVPSTSVLKDIFLNTNLFPQRVVRHEIKTRNTGWRHQGAYILYMDGNSVSDLVDFWNLRAMGKAVIPAPTQLQGDPEFREFVKSFIRSEFRINRHNKKVTYGASFLRGRTQKMEAMQEFATSLDVPAFMKDVHPDGRFITLQHWYPRIWNEWAIDKDGARPSTIYSKEETYEFDEVKERVSFEMVRPGFADKYAFHDCPRYANEIYPRFYGEVEPLAEAFPSDYGRETIWALSDFGGMPDESRIGRTGLIRLIKLDRRMSWTLPIAENVFAAWLKDKGLKVKLSSCGLLAKRIYTQLEGWIAVLANRKVLDLFALMTKPSKESQGLHFEDVKDRLRPDDGIEHSNNHTFNTLAKKGIFSLGLTSQCPECTRHPWYPVASLNDELSCSLCAKKVSAIDAVSRKANWSLKLAGAFSVGNSADGAYSVLLSLDFFKKMDHLQQTPIRSFTAVDEARGINLEADFGLLWQETVYGESQEGVVFGECKSYNEFEEEDFVKMQKLGKMFPGAILAFCTLRESLTTKEIKALKRIAKEGRKQWKTERPINPVLILTGRELLTHNRAPYCWDDLPHPRHPREVRTLLDMANFTQQLYLDLPHWQEDWVKEIEKRRGKKLAVKKVAKKKPAKKEAKKLS